jgi:transcriptional regulator with XRE-family HTH domain
MERLGVAIRTRRGALRLTQAELGSQVGVSVKTVNNWETARTGAPRAGTASALERALQWRAGSIRDVLLGGEPTVTEENSGPAPEVDRRPVGLGLDDAAEGLTPEEIQPVLDQIRLVKRLKGLAE